MCGGFPRVVSEVGAMMAQMAKAANQQVRRAIAV
jgi:hypothetical protein